MRYVCTQQVCTLYTVQQLYKSIFLVHIKSIHCVVYFINQSHLHLKRFSQKSLQKFFQNTTGEKPTECNIYKYASLVLMKDNG